MTTRLKLPCHVTRRERPSFRRDHTTGEIATLLGMAPRTVTKLIDSGLMRGYRLPTSKDRRVPVAALVQFCREQNVPLPPQLSPGAVILSPRAGVLADSLSGHLPEEWRLHPCTSPLAAGLAVAQNAPVILIVDLLVGRETAREACRDAGKCAGTPVVVLLAEDSSEPLNGESDANGFGWPVDVAAVAKRLEALAEGR